MVDPVFSIVIPNWNGASFLHRCVNATVLSAQAAEMPYEVIIVDDASSDNAIDGVAASFPKIRILRNERNIGFAASVNRGISQARSPLVVLFNNDLSPSPPMIRELIAPMLAEDDVFAVSGKTVDWYTGALNHVSMLARIEDGQLRLAYEDPGQRSETMFFQGGSCAVRRQPFLDFGGFAAVFHPGYWEDYDLSYLALKAGWRIIYNPLASAMHVGQGSMRRAYGEATLVRVKARNALLFQWLNFSDPALVRAICRRLPAQITSDFAHARHNEWRGAVDALRYLAQIIKLREDRRLKWKLSDADIFAKFAGRGTLC